MNAQNWLRVETLHLKHLAVPIWHHKSRPRPRPLALPNWPAKPKGAGMPSGFSDYTDQRARAHEEAKKRPGNQMTREEAFLPDAPGSGPRWTARRLMPTALATARPVQVAFPGGSEHGSANTFATVFAGKGALPGLRVLSRKRPSTPCSA